MVYVLTDDSGYCKIGVTQNLKSRIASLQCGNPRKIRPVKTITTRDTMGDFLLENVLHEEYAQFSVGDWKSEWFDEKGLQELIYAGADTIEEIADRHGIHNLHVVKTKVFLSSELHSVICLRDAGYISNHTLVALRENNHINTVEELEHRLNGKYALSRIGEIREREIRQAIQNFKEDINNGITQIQQRPAQEII